MRTLAIITFFCTGGLMLLGCDSTVEPLGVDAASPDVVLAQKGTGTSFARPFRGTWRADGPPPPPTMPPPQGVCAPGALGYQFHTFTGNATHIGRFAMGVGLCDFGGYYEGTATITAANGDTIEMDFYNGLVIAVDLPFIITRDEFTFTGGTGRFASVSGGGVETVRFDTRVGFGTGTMEGQIHYHAHDRSQGDW